MAGEPPELFRNGGGGCWGCTLVAVGLRGEAAGCRGDNGVEVEGNIEAFIDKDFFKSTRGEATLAVLFVLEMATGGTRGEVRVAELGELGKATGGTRGDVAGDTKEAASMCAGAAMPEFFRSVCLAYYTSSNQFIENES